MHSLIFFRNEEATQRSVVYKMIYVDNIIGVYVGSVELHKVHMLEYKCNMDTNKLSVVEFSDKD